MKEKTMKQSGLYNKDAAKIFKGAERIICWTDDNDVFLTNSFVLYRMDAATYNDLFLPVTKTPAGEWSIWSGVKDDAEGCANGLKKVWKQAVEKADGMRGAGVKPLAFSPIEYKDASMKSPAALHYSPSGDFIVAFNSAFFAGFNGFPDAYTDKPISPAVCYANVNGHDEPIALVVPIRISENASRAGRSYFVANDDADAVTQECRKLRERVQDQAREIESAARKIAELEKAISGAENQQPTMDAQVVDLEQKAHTALATVEKLGCKATLKGAKTARPVVWIENGENVADALKAAGAMFSRKRNAYYIAVA